MAKLSQKSHLISEATTIIATETIIGSEIRCGHYDALSLFIDYVKGDEDGLFIVPYTMWESEGDGYQLQTWDATGAIRTVTESKFHLTASGKYLMTFDIRGIEFMKFMQDADGGTPDGTIVAAYAFTGS